MTKVTTTLPPLMRLLGGFIREIEDQAGIPTRPGEDPGVSISFTLEVQIKGSVQSFTFAMPCPHIPRKNQHVDIVFEGVKIGWYEIYEDKEIEKLYRDLIARISPELIHNSEPWACLECGLSCYIFA
jgi:hypothetical protein